MTPVSLDVIRLCSQLLRDMPPEVALVLRDMIGAEMEVQGKMERGSVGGLFAALRSDLPPPNGRQTRVTRDNAMVAGIVAAAKIAKTVPRSAPPSGPRLVYNKDITA